MARTITLDKSSSADGVAVTANLASATQFFPIVTITTPRSKVYTYRHQSDLVLKLLTAAAAEIAASSRIIFATRMPTQRRSSDETGTYTYAAWRNIPVQSSTGEPTQYNLETSPKRRISFNRGGDIIAPQEHVMEMLLQSSDVVDWTQAGTNFEWVVVESDVATQVAV